MRRKTIHAAVLAALVFVLPLITAGPASAHEARKIGKYLFVAGWGTEPAFTGVPNRVQLFLSLNDKPVNDLGDTLKVEVSFGTDKMSLSMEPKFEVGEFGQEGDYGADVTPTRPGKYTFHFTGTVKGDAIDASFTSSETGFAEVVELTSSEFPVKDPSNAQLAQLIDRSSARLAAKVNDDIDTVKILAYVGIGLGALGLIAALTLGRTKKTAA
jgi:hypothetical protein